MKNLKERWKRAAIGLAAILLTVQLPVQLPVTAFAEEAVKQETAAEPVITQEMTAAAETSEQTENKVASETSEQTEDKAVSDTPEEPGDKNGDEAPVEAAVPVERSTPAEASDKGSEDEAEKKTPAFKESSSLDGVRITVEAEEGVFPEWTELSVEKVTKAQEEEAQEAVEDKRPEEQNVAASYTYDIKVLDKDGNEIQPADESKVKVSFTLEEVADANLTTNVYHIVEEDSQNGGDSGEAAPKEGDDLKNSRNEETDAGNSAELTAEKLEVETDGDTAIVETDGFSLYTVEFTYGSMQYVLPGDSEVALSDILEAVGLSGEASAVEVSDTSLFSAEKNKDGEWIVTAHKAFSTKEWMKVTINDKEYKITVTDDSDTMSFAGLQAQINGAANGDTVKLEKDVKWKESYPRASGDDSKPLEIPSGKTVTLDLNGHTIDRGLKGWINGVTNANVITVSGNLTLTDGSADGTGKLTGGNTTKEGGGVFIDQNATFTMEGGSITDCITNSQGGGVNVNGTFNMTGGTISGCTAPNGAGGGVKVSNKGTFNMTGGTISGCTGRGVFVDIGATFTMSGSARIDGCTNFSGGGVYVNGGTFTMEGGTITGCTATIGTDDAQGGGGVYVYGGTFNVSGSPVISGNKKGDKTNNVTLNGSKTITVTGALTDGAEIRVNADKGVAFAKKEGSYNITDTDLAKFHSDKDSSLVAAEDSDGSVKFFTPWEALQVKFNNASTGAGSPTRITLTGDVTADEGDTALVIPAGRYVTLNLNGHTIDRGLTNENAKDAGNVITVNGNLTLTDSSTDHTGKITGGNNSGSGGGVLVDGGKFTMSGGTIKRCNATFGGGVYVAGDTASRGTFTMENGTITGCTATNNGGGVYVDEGSTFTMSGGTISDCRATGEDSEGGGVYVYEGSTFTMNGGTISGCKAINSGGGVSVSRGKFTMESGTIDQCTATGYESRGGGVCVISYGTFTMSGGTISRCKADEGGGVFVESEGGTFTMSGGTIDQCEARTGDGGGVYVNVKGGTFTMSGGTICGCKANNSGGGVYVNSGGGGGKFTMESGTISSCSAHNGGGVDIEGGTFTMKGGTITGCTATNNGGGVNVYGGTFNISGVPVIGGNKKSENANNVVLKSSKTIIVTGELKPGAEIWVNAGKDVAFAKKEDSYSITDTDLAKFHSDADSSLVAAEDSDGSVKFFTPWEALQVKFNNASTGAGSPTRITLTGNFTAGEGDTALVIPAGKYVTLDLSGNTIDRGLANKSAKDNGNVIKVKGTLILKDSSTGHTGTLTGGNITGNGGGVYVGESGKFTMENSTISGCNANGYGGGVYVNSRGTFTMENSTISGCSATGDQSKGGGVYVYEGSTFTMSGGTITGCNAVGAGGVYVVDGEFTMTGGTIRGCTATDGGGVFIYADSTFTMSGGTIDQCEARTGNGGGVLVDADSTFTMEGGTIRGCTATNGGGVFIYADSTFTMSGGTITGCNAVGAGGVFVNDNCTFQVSGAPVIRDNKKDGNDNNVVLVGSTTITVTGELKPGAEIYINADKGTTVAEKGGSRTDPLTETEAGYFKSDVDSKLLGGLNVDGQVVLKDPLPALTGASNLIYNGNAQTPALTFEGATLTAGTDYTVSYKKVAGGTETEISGAPKDAGSYKAVATGTGSYTGTSEAEFTIARKEVTVSSGITAEDKSYDGTTAATLVTTGAVFYGICRGDSLTVSGTGTFENASVGTNKTVTINQSSLTLGGTSSGNYVLAGSGNQPTATANITKATPTIETKPVASEITYGQTLANSNLTNGAAKLGETSIEGSFAWSDNTIAPAVSDSNKTEYTVTFTPNNSRNLNTTTCKVKLIVNKADIPTGDITAPTAKTDLAYTGQSQALITAGSVTGGIGTMQYALGDANGATQPYTTSIPTGTNAGTYYVWYKVKGDKNHNDTEGVAISPVVIAKSRHSEIALDAMIIADNTREIDLSSYIEEGGSLGTPVKTDVNNIIDGDPAVVGTTLRFKAVVDIVDKSATISVPVEDSKNYETYNIVISVRGVDKYTQELIFEKTSVTLKAGETFTNKLNGAETSVSYKSSDESVAKVDGDGKLTAEGNGKAVITATAVETDEYYGASAEYTVEVEGGSDKVPLTGTGDHYASENDNIAPVSSSGKVTDLKLDFSRVAESGVNPAGLKMTAVKGTKLTTTGKLKDKNSFKTTGGVKVHVDKKTLIAKITCKKNGSTTLTMEDGITYTVNFTVQKPKAQKSAKNISKGGSTVIKNIKDLFGTDIDAGVITIQKQKHSQAKVLDNSIYIDPKEKDSIKLQYKYLNRKYKLKMNVK